MSMPYSRFLIDIGHGPNNLGQGSYDSGAMGDAGEAEHDLAVWCVAEAFYAISDQFDMILAPEVGRSQVVQWANELYKPGDYLLSIHLNSASSRKATGSEVVYGSNAPTDRTYEAAIVAAKIASTLKLPNRGAIPDSATPNGSKTEKGLVVLTQTKCPALLLELGFISNPKDILAVRQKGAGAICETIRLLASLNHSSNDAVV